MCLQVEPQGPMDITEEET